MDNIAYFRQLVDTYNREIQESRIQYATMVQSLVPSNQHRLREFQVQMQQQKIKNELEIYNRHKPRLIVCFTSDEQGDFSVLFALPQGGVASLVEKNGDIELYGSYNQREFTPMALGPADAIQLGGPKIYQLMADVNNLSLAKQVLGPVHSMSRDHISIWILD
jgi:hypothetical protein